MSIGTINVQQIGAYCWRIPHQGQMRYVAEIYDATAAHALELCLDQITVTIHTGSRGLGYQGCDEASQVMQHTTPLIPRSKLSPPARSPSNPLARAGKRG